MFRAILSSNWAKFIAVLMQCVAYPFFYDYLVQKSPWLSDSDIHGFLVDWLLIFNIKINFQVTSAYLLLTLCEGFVFYFLRLAYNTLYPFLWAKFRKIRLAIIEQRKLDKQVRMLLMLVPLFIAALYFTAYDTNATFKGLTQGVAIINGEPKVTQVSDTFTIGLAVLLALFITLSTEIFLIFSRNIYMIEDMFKDSDFDELMERYDPEPKPTTS
jgi:hypothetical protein